MISSKSSNGLKMQKIINVLSIASFVISGSIAGAGVYVYANKDALIEGAKEKIQKELTKSNEPVTINEFITFYIEKNRKEKMFI